MRLNYWDLIKGIAIISVVGIHATGFISSLPSDSYSYYAGIYIRQALNFAVPIFLFISGYFSFSNSNKNNLSSIKKRSIRILPPYLFWSFIYMLLNYELFNEHFTLKQMISGLVFGGAITVGYFVIVIMQYTILTPAIERIKTINQHIIIMSFLFVTGIIFTYSTKYLFPESKLSAFPFSAIPFFVWYPFYHLGYFLSKYQPVIKLKNKALIAICMAALTLSLAEGFLTAHAIGYDFAVSQTKITSIIFSISICFLIYKNNNASVKNNIFTYLGTISYGIYLIHYFAISATIKAYGKEIITYKYPLLIVACITIFSLSISVSLIAIIKKTTGKSISKYIVG